MMMMMTMTNSIRHLVGRLAAAISTTLDILIIAFRPYERKYDAMIENHHVSALAMYD